MAHTFFPKTGDCLSHYFCGENSCFLIDTTHINESDETDTGCHKCFDSDSSPCIYSCNSCGSQFCHPCMIKWGGIIGNSLLLRRHFPSFENCLDENDVDMNFMKKTNGIMHRICNIWCFIGEIVKNISSLGRHRIIVRDVMNQEVEIHFYLQNNNLISPQKLQIGALICIRYALIHHFLDGARGIRMEDEDLDFITFIANVSLQELKDIDSTGCLMQYYQNNVLNKRNKIRLNTKCWYSRCSKSKSLSRCTGCRMALYCCTEHQRKDWKEKHKYLCKQMKKILTLCSVDLKIHFDERSLVSFKMNTKELLHGGLKKYFKKHKGFYSRSKVEALFFISYKHYFEMDSFSVSMRNEFGLMYDRYHQRYIDKEIKPVTSRYYTNFLNKLIPMIAKSIDSYIYTASFGENVINYVHSPSLKMSNGIYKLFDQFINLYSIYSHRLCLIECWKICYRFGENMIGFKHHPNVRKECMFCMLDIILYSNYDTIHDDVRDGFLWWQCDRIQNKIFGTKCGYSKCDNIEKHNERYKMCSQCKIVFYCNRKCQKKDWKSGHKKKCAAVKALYN